jgi:hypothetical protein
MLHCSTPNWIFNQQRKISAIPVTSIPSRLIDFIWSQQIFFQEIRIYKSFVCRYEKLVSQNEFHELFINA